MCNICLLVTFNLVDLNIVESELWGCYNWDMKQYILIMETPFF